MKKLFAILMFCAALNGMAQTRKYVNEFLHLGVGGRQLGMGKAGTTSTEDVYAGYWNPAGLAAMKDNLQVGFMHNFYFQSIANFDYLAIAAKGPKNNAFGLSILRFGVDGILNTLDLIRNGEINYGRVTEFSAVDYAFMPTYSQKNRLVRHPNLVFSWGVSAKLINRQVGDFARAWGFGIDAAVKLEDYKKNWGLSLVSRDITGTYNNWSFQFTQSQKDILYQTGNTIPVSSLEIGVPRFTLGGYRRMKSDKFFLLGEGNIDVTTDGKRNTLISTNFISADLRAGIEGGIINEDKNFEFAMRAGVYNFQNETRQNGKKGMTVQPTVGVGISMDKFRLDYALAGFGAAGSGLYSNIISVVFNINK